MLGFVIPTWNRADQLRRCVEAMMVQEADQVLIVDDASTDHTPEVGMEFVDRFPLTVRYLRYEERAGFAGNYKRAIENADTDYIWTFGDDDLLMDSAYNFVKGVINSTQYDFYHVAETKRTVKAEAMNGHLLQICNGIGWIDFTGFISGNIGRTGLMKKGVQSANWELFSKSSFPQSLGILEVMAERPAMMIEMGCVESPPADVPETLKRWSEDEICWKYLYVGNALKALKDQGSIPAKVSEVFFRYLEESLFSRMMRDFNGRAVLNPSLLKPSDWECFLHMAELVEEPRGSILVEWIQNIRKISDEKREVFQASADAYAELSAIAGRIELPQYPHSYLP